MEKRYPILIVFEDLLSFVAPAGDVVEGVGVVDPQRPRHGKRATTTERLKSNVKI